MNQLSGRAGVRGLPTELQTDELSPIADQTVTMVSYDCPKRRRNRVRTYNCLMSFNMIRVFLNQTYRLAVEILWKAEEYYASRLDFVSIQRHRSRLIWIVRRFGCPGKLKRIGCSLSIMLNRTKPLDWSYRLAVYLLRQFLGIDESVFASPQLGPHRKHIF
jgi:hypothetical protein